MHGLLQILLSIAALVGLMLVMAALFFGFSWAVMSLVRFFPVIGSKHRHDRWSELTKRSGRDK